MQIELKRKKHRLLVVWERSRVNPKSYRVRRLQANKKGFLKQCQEASVEAITCYQLLLEGYMH